MKTLYLDLSMGAAGDMLTAALLELCPDREEMLQRLNGLAIPGVRFQPEQGQKLGVPGTHMAVTVHGEEEGEGHHHAHNAMVDIRNIIQGLHASRWVKDKALAVYHRIAKAESQVHEEPVNLIHFHEVGALDAVADVAAVCTLLEALAPEKILASPIHVGFGTLWCAHGRLPVPAPATALLLEGLPHEPGEVEGELCTPTGAALIREFVEGFGEMPKGTVLKEGRGLGKKDFPKPNCLRAFEIE